MFGYSVVAASFGLFARNLYYIKTFITLINQAKQELESLYLEESKEIFISKKEMLPGSYEQLDDKHELAFALKPGFEEEIRYLFGMNTPLFHTACAYALRQKNASIS